VPGSSELAQRIRVFDWSKTPLGPIADWPQSLKNATAMVVASPVAIVMLWGPDGVMIYNDAYSLFAGERHPHLLGSNVREGWAEVDDFNDNVMKVGLAGGTLSYKDQELTLHRNGEPEQVWMNLDYSPVYDESGRPAGVIAIVVETSQRVLADKERAAAEHAREMGRTWDVSPDLLSVMTPDGLFERVNPAWTVTLGWSPEHITRTPYMDFVHPDDLARSHDAFDRVRQGDPVLRFENRYRHADGGWRCLSWVAVPVEGKFYCSARDVTAEKEAEAERDRLWRLSEDMLARADYAGNLKAVNPAWTKVLGWSEQDLLTNPYADIIHPENIDVTFEALQSMGDTGQPTRFENRIQTATGAWKPIGWTVSPEPGGVHFIAVGRDLTDDKARESELLLAQEALRQSQKMEAVGHLTGGIAHDFNNLLAGISGSLELMQKRMGEGRLTDLDRYMDAAQASSQRAAALTQRLLAFSRRQTLDPRAVDANRLISGMEELLRRSIGPQVELDVVAGDDLWTALVDGSQLENALLNLCINARDAMPDGGRLTIETRNAVLDDRAARNKELAAGEYLAIIVTDSGTGMTPEVASRAFDPFFTTKPLGQGTGLGLSMVYGFVRQSGGQVRVDSRPGRGTAMRLYLPRHLGEAEVEDGPALPLPQEPGVGEVVLVIDDEPTVRMLIVEILQESGYRAIEAHDGPSGLKILQSDQQVDLLITDVGLPGGMNGRQVADAARTTRPDLRVLFVTGYAENAAVGAGQLDAGMAVITKPFAMAALGGKVREMLEA